MTTSPVQRLRPVHKCRCCDVGTPGQRLPGAHPGSAETEGSVRQGQRDRVARSERRVDICVLVELTAKDSGVQEAVDILQLCRDRLSHVNLPAGMHAFFQEQRLGPFEHDKELTPMVQLYTIPPHQRCGRTRWCQLHNGRDTALWSVQQDFES